MSKNVLFFNKNNLIKALHKKMIRDIPIQYREMLQKLFHHNFNSNDIIYAKTLPHEEKANIQIIAGGKRKNILFVERTNIIMEKCPLDTFISYLEKEGATPLITSTIKLYHYADGTENGIGDKRLLRPIFYSLMQNRINLTNKVLSKVNLLKCNLIRTILETGFKGYQNKVDAYCFGNSKKIIYISTADFITYVLMIKRHSNLALYIGPVRIDGGIKNLDVRELPYLRKDTVTFSFPLLFSTIAKATKYFKEIKGR